MLRIRPTRHSKALNVNFVLRKYWVHPSHCCIRILILGYHAEIVYKIGIFCSNSRLVRRIDCWLKLNAWKTFFSPKILENQSQIGPQLNILFWNTSNFLIWLFKKSFFLRIQSACYQFHLKRRSFRISPYIICHKKVLNFCEGNRLLTSLSILRISCLSFEVAESYFLKSNRKNGSKKKLVLGPYLE